MKLSNKIIEKWKDDNVVFIEQVIKSGCKLNDNLLHGKFILYEDDDDLYCKGEYNMGVRINRWVWYNGDNIYKIIYYKIIGNDNVRDYVLFNLNGKINSTFRMINDCEIGWEINNFYSGEIKEKDLFDNKGKIIYHESYTELSNLRKQNIYI
jgi:hypothetical protein